MVTEINEGRPSRPLFPLGEEAIMRASCNLRDVTRTEDVKKIREHFEIVYGREYVTPEVRHLFGNKIQEIPESGADQNFYVFGATISLDAIGLGAILNGIPVTGVNKESISAYRQIRQRVVGSRWFEASDDVLALLERKLATLLRDADPSFQMAVEEIPDDERSRGALRENIAFLLGLCDMYFPHRYAEDLATIVEDDL